MTKNLEYLIRDIYDSAKKNEIDWSKYYPELEEITNNTLDSIREHFVGTTNFVGNYFFSKEMRIKRKEHTKKTYNTLMKKGYNKNVAKYVSKFTPMPVENNYGQNLFVHTIGFVVGRVQKPMLELISHYSKLPYKKLEPATYIMEYINNPFSGAQISAEALVLINGVYAIATGESLSLENNTLIILGTTALKFVHTIVDHVEYKKKNKYRANHAMAIVPASWIAYIPSTIYSLSKKYNDYIEKKRNGNTTPSK